MQTEKCIEFVNFVQELPAPQEDIEHWLNVAAKFDYYFCDDLYIVALFHDVIEDGYCTMSELIERFNLTEEQQIALDMITRSKGWKYFDYIRYITNNEIARKVKIEDLKDNMRRCLDDLDNRWSLLRRYAKAYAILTDKWEEKEHD